ncbi:MAG: glycosyltransferase family 39 protein [Deltaproteobacteria bacterium]|nr:MAG: glycosyltransferase family 39 protein [Deltaproteobacteria bacterium]
MHAAPDDTSGRDPDDPAAEGDAGDDVAADDPAEDDPAENDHAAAPDPAHPPRRDSRTDPWLPGPRLPERLHGTPLPSLDRRWLADWRTLAFVAFAACLVFLPGVGSFGLWDPWEVHYGEVGRQMVERGDWISPWWGGHWAPPDHRPEGTWFFSKPVLLLWSMALGYQFFGFTEFAARIGVALIAIFGVISVYLAGSRIWRPRVGVLMALALATSPFYTVLGRQAQTDMPFVGLLTAALAFFMMGAFGRDRHHQVDRTSWGFFIVVLLLLMVPQLHTITVGQLRWHTHVHPVEAALMYGPVQCGLYLAALGLWAWLVWRSPHRTRGQLYLHTFYVLVALATLAKGLLGFGLPGAIILLYLIVSGEWSLLRRAEIIPGVLLCIAVGFPWYGAMFARHGGIGGAFWDRFIIHDHFRRLAEGVHQTDTGSFEHFIRWLGVGLFPWGSLLPFLSVRALLGLDASTRSDEDRARLFLILWFLVAFTLFTLSSTKFHHYIFPAVPAIALLAALAVHDLLERGHTDHLRPLLAVGTLAFAAIVAVDLVADPQTIKNLHTYRYDRLWDHENWTPGFRRALAILVTTSVLGLLMLVLRPRRLRIAGATTLGASALAIALWSLHVYMPTLSPTWSQKELWDTYYRLCTPMPPPPGAHPMKRYCVEPVVGYRLSWRGETYHTQNEIVPIPGDGDDLWAAFLDLNKDDCFYVFTFRFRLNRLRHDLPPHLRETVEVVHDDNLKFILARVGCPPLHAEDHDSPGDDPPAPEPSDDDGRD